nr:MAG TPA: hypothetical protein [Caudoviricetes sp.]
MIFENLFYLRVHYINKLIVLKCSCNVFKCS